MFQNLAKFWGGGQFDPPLTQLGGGVKLTPQKFMSKMGNKKSIK